MFPKSTVARLTVGACLALILAILGVVAWTQWLAPQESASTQAIGGPFTLTNTKGEQVTAADLHGDYTLVFFGYTHCPDVCPTTLNGISQALDVIAEQQPETAEQVTPVFISFDPERDDVARMRDYIASFHPRLIGLTGTPEQIAKAADAYHVSYSKVDPDSMDKSALSGSGDGANHAEMDHGTYMMQHSTYVFLMGPEGEYIDHVGAAAGAPRIAEMIRQNVGS